MLRRFDVWLIMHLAQPSLNWLGRHLGLTRTQILYYSLVASFVSEAAYLILTVHGFWLIIDLAANGLIIILWLNVGILPSTVYRHLTFWYMIRVSGLIIFLTSLFNFLDTFSSFLILCFFYWSACEDPPKRERKLGKLKFSSVHS